jgi:mannosyltransferase
MSLRFRPYFIGVIGFALMLWNLGVPSLWQDEAATIGAANRPLDSLWRLVQNIDAVHGLYYGFVHFWGSAFGFGPFWLRVPSAIFVGLSTFLLFQLALKLRFSADVATSAAIIFIALPRTAIAGSEARSNALSATMAIALILVLVWALEGDRNLLRWLAFTAVLTLSIYTFLFSALMLVPISIYLAINHRQQIWKFGLASLAALALTAPLIYFAYQERGQVGWIYAKPLTEYLWESLVAVDYNRAWPMALIGLGLCIVAIARKTSLLVVLWATLPSALLIAVSLCFEPYFVDHYLTFTTGATALLIALGVHALPGSRLQWLVLGVLLVLSMPNFVQSREPMAKGTEWAKVAAAVNDNSSPGDALLLPDPASKAARAIDLMVVAYAPEFEGRLDLTLAAKPADTNKLFGVRSKVVKAAEPISDKVLVLSVPAEGLPKLPTWLNDKFSAKQTLKFETTQITIFERIN